MTKSSTTTKPKSYENYIHGKWIAEGSKGKFLNINPADTRDVIG